MIRVKTTARLTLYLYLLVLAFFAVQSAQAETLLVTPTGSTPCKSGLFSVPRIQEAVNSVAAGSTIYICPGNYPEQVVITKGITLVGVSGNGATGAAADGANNPTIVPPSAGLVVSAKDLYGNPNGQPTAAQVLVQTPSNRLSTPIVVNISNLIVDGTGGASSFQDCTTDFVGIYYQNASGTLNHVTARFQELSQSLFGCQNGLAIYAQSGYGTGGAAKVAIDHSSVHDYDKNGITADGSGTNATITANYVVGIGPTTLIAQNGIQLSDSAIGTISGNTVTDDVYINPADCSTPSNPPCWSATGILLYDSGGSSAKVVTVTANTVSNAQGGVIIVGDSSGTADYNKVTSNKITTSPSAGIYLLDGIDLCSNNNTAKSNTVFNSSGSGIHIDSECEESGGTSGNNNTVANNTINEACAGVLEGTGAGNSISGNLTYNVLQVTYAGDSCPSGSGGVAAEKERFGRRESLRPSPHRANN